jgi:hypothetical protein
MGRLYAIERLVGFARRNGFVIGLACIAIVGLFGLRFIWFNNEMWFDLENHDTRVLLQTIRSEQQPFKWFVSDWPLYNGFYRPLPALSFEMDDRLFGNNLRLYCFTNGCIAMVCAFGVVWFVYEAFRNRLAAVFAGLMFSGWQTGLVDFLPLEWAGGIVAVVAMLASLLTGGGGIRVGLVAAALTLLAARELSCWLDIVDIIGMDFSYRAIGWPVGRTATMATMFALPCVAAYCRWERERKHGWSVFSILFLVLALMCYEQSVVVPALLLGTAVALHLQKVKVRWAWHAAPLAILGVYLWLHTRFLPKSRYHDQAYRGTGGGMRDTLSWLFPGTHEIKFLPVFLTPDIGFFAVFIDRFWVYVVQSASSLIAYLSFRKHWMPIAYGLLASTGAYLPMAFQQPLVHYHHLPMAFRTPFVVWLTFLAYENCKLAISKRQSTS